MSLIVHRAPRADHARRRAGRPAARRRWTTRSPRSSCWSRRAGSSAGSASGSPTGWATPRAARTASAPACEFRSPASLVAERHGHPRGRPVGAGRAGLAAARRWSTPAPARPGAGRSARTSATARSGEEGELRRGRRYAVARRLARLFASYAVQRPDPARRLGAGRDTDGAGGAARPTDLTWQPELWRLLVAEVGRAVARPAAPRRARRRCADGAGRRSTCRRGSRCSGTPGSR